MTEVCQYLKNWFDRGQNKFYGEFTIANGSITSAEHGNMGLKEGQYYRIVGSALNDGVWRNPEEEGTVSLRDETFEGAVWLMAIPPAVVSISNQIDQWTEKYGAIDGPMMSPYSSESFGGYSYTKSQGGTGTNGVPVNGWVNVFGTQLARWKKL